MVPLIGCWFRYVAHPSYQRDLGYPHKSWAHRYQPRPCHRPFYYSIPLGPRCACLSFLLFLLLKSMTARLAKQLYYSCRILEWWDEEWDCLHVGMAHVLLQILTLFYHTLQINDLDDPADMFFSLTESPWIRAGRQYSVRVCHLYFVLWHFHWQISRTCGLIPTMAPLSATWRYIMCHLMALLLSCSRMPEMSLKGLNPHVRDLNGAWIRMELASMCEHVYSVHSFVLFVSPNCDHIFSLTYVCNVTVNMNLEMSLILGQISTSSTT